jgi:hypothetical protein
MDSQYVGCMIHTMRTMFLNSTKPQRPTYCKANGHQQPNRWLLKTGNQQLVHRNNFGEEIPVSRCGRWYEDNSLCHESFMRSFVKDSLIRHTCPYTSGTPDNSVTPLLKQSFKALLMIFGNFSNLGRAVMLIQNEHPHLWSGYNCQLSPRKT